MTNYPPSPVPSDKNLWPDELPFTAFGQWEHGRMDNRVFEQDTYWVDITGTPHLLDEMSTEYRIAVIMHCRENADYFYASTLMRWAMQATGDVLLGRGDDVVADLAHGDWVRSMEPADWIEATPLIRRLHALLDEAPSG